MVIGGGTIYPELNFTLPTMQIEAGTMAEVRSQYTQMIDGVCGRAAELEVPGMVVEFELLPPMTIVPEWGAEVTAILRSTLDRYAQSDGLKSALRITPNDTREHHRPPIMRHGDYWEQMIRSFELNAEAGADLFSIESTGGKEVHDDGILNADLPSVAFALGVLGARDMAFLWDMIVGVSQAWRHPRGGLVVWVRKHGHGAGGEEVHPPSLGCCHPGHDRGPCSCCTRARRRRTKQGLRVREPVLEGNHRLPYFCRGCGRRLCTPFAGGQCLPRHG
jgi:hypothetical protein